MAAKSVEDLHCENVNITKDTALTEKGRDGRGRADSVNMRDKTWHRLARAVRRGLAISGLKKRPNVIFVMRTELNYTNLSWRVRRRSSFSGEVRRPYAATSHSGSRR